MVGTVEEELKRRDIPDPEIISGFSRSIIGETVRLEIPFRDVVSMRQAADLLRGLAEHFDFYSRQQNLPAQTILVHLAMATRNTNAKLREIRGRGRPKKSHEDA